jgi:ATP-dependent DNA helicase RecQ
VTAVPSTNRSLVLDFATRLAAELGVPFRDVVRRTREAPPQKEMENSAQQVRNVQGAFSVEGPVPPTGVLLVDDIFDSRWTLTVIGIVLREAGAGPVHPYTLARAVSD